MLYAYIHIYIYIHIRIQYYLIKLASTHAHIYTYIHTHTYIQICIPEIPRLGADVLLELAERQIDDRQAQLGAANDFVEWILMATNGKKGKMGYNPDIIAPLCLVE